MPGYRKTVVVSCCIAASVFAGHCGKPAAIGVAREEKRPSTSKTSGRNVVQYQPGIRIDYRVPQVEVQAVVILRQGALELFAYGRAPIPKEHESILLLDVSAEAVYQALGLIGLRPGQPVRYDPETESVVPPSGDPVDVLVRCVRGEETIEVHACDWMVDLELQRPMERTHWLFAGSRRLDDGSFGANLEGTVVTVVDFDTAVLSLPGTHSASNADLRLGANTEQIPPEGTPVTLILRPARAP